jgi:hypothetical protein
VTSLVVVICLSNAALMISVGILGEYVGRIYGSCPSGFQPEIGTEETVVVEAGSHLA